MMERKTSKHSKSDRNPARIRVSVVLLLTGILFFSSSCQSTQRKPSESPSDSVVTQQIEGTSIQLTPSQVKDGGLLVVTVMRNENDRFDELSGKWKEIDVPFFEIAGGYQALVGISYDHPPGPSQFEISWRLPSGAKTSKLIPFEIISGAYRSEVLRVDPKHVSPPAKAIKRIQREGAKVSAIYRQITQERLWSGKWILPVDSAYTSVYGTRRVYNGALRSVHYGLDLKAPTGVPIYAPAAGRVVLAQDLYFTGNTVILDHGYGFYTVYAHLSKLDVKLGQLVRQSKRLGLSGATGRASGPHLHWGAVVNRVKFNPEDLVKIFDSNDKNGNPLP